MHRPPEGLADEVSRELMGEAVLWAGSPDRWAYGARRWRKAVLGIPFTAFAVFWTWQATRGLPLHGEVGFAWFFPAWGCMFVLFGLSMLLSPLMHAWAAGGVYYVVTEKRAVIFERVFRLKIRSFRPSSVARFERVSRGGPGGDLIFERVVERRSRGGADTTEIGFLGLADCAGAERALNRLIASQPSN